MWILRLMLACEADQDSSIAACSPRAAGCAARSRSVRGSPSSGSTQVRRQLGMREQRQAEPREDRQRLAQIALGDVLELVDTRRDREST